MSELSGCFVKFPNLTCIMPLGALIQSRAQAQLFKYNLSVHIKVKSKYLMRRRALKSEVWAESVDLGGSLFNSKNWMCFGYCAEVSQIQAHARLFNSERSKYSEDNVDHSIGWGAVG